MRISVAMCTFNGERYLEEQLESIARQTRLPDELIVSDDASTDGTGRLIAEFADRAPFPVKLDVNEKRLGVVRNYERAISRCDGDVVVLCDQDDVWLTARLALLERTFSANPNLALAFSDAYLRDHAGRRTGDRFWTIVGFSPRQQRHLRRDPFGQIMSRSIVTGCTMALRTARRDLVLPFPDELESRSPVFHDRWISLALSPAFDVAVIDEPLVEYRLHPSQHVGIPALTIRKLVPSLFMRWRSAAVPTHEHTRRLEATIGLLDIIEGRLRSHAPAPARERAIARVREAKAHLRARASIRGSRLRRLGPVLREAGTGRYRRYSLGTASAVADVVRTDRHWAPGERVRRSR